MPVHLSPFRCHSMMSWQCPLSLLLFFFPMCCCSFFFPSSPSAAPLGHSSCHLVQLQRRQCLWRNGPSGKQRSFGCRCPAAVHGQRCLVATLSSQAPECQMLWKKASRDPLPQCDYLWPLWQAPAVEFMCPNLSGAHPNVIKVNSKLAHGHHIQASE